MKKSFVSRVIGIVSLSMVLLFALQNALQIASSRNHFYQSADILVGQIEEMLDSNDKAVRDLSDSLKKDYIVRAHACSYIIENSNISEQDVQEMKKIAGLLEVDEIHLFDTEGYIYGGTLPQYNGLNFDSGVQMRFFKPMLSDYNLSLCQDMTPNTAEGKQMMYALVWREDRKGMVQIGLTPTTLLEQMTINQVSNILASVPTNDNVYFVADHATGKVMGCTKSSYQGASLKDIGIERAGFSRRETSHFSVEIEGTPCLAAFRVCGRYEIGVCQTKKDVYESTYLSFVIVFVYLLFASVVIVSVVNFMEKKERKKEKEYQEQLEMALDQANAANQAKTAFLTNMSHDIRTPMNAIIGFAELLEKSGSNEQKRDECIAKIKSSSVYLLEIINHVLEMARIEKGQMILNESVWSVEQFENALMSAFREERGRKDLKFNREIVVKHPYVWCDSAKIQEIFGNLMSNAIKYTPEGGRITLRIHELSSDKEGYTVYRTEIEDNGIGISEDFLPYIFEEFTRERNTTQSKIGGAGLGMSIAKRFVELMGGTITVESKAGKGTRFIVTIPHRIAYKGRTGSLGEERTKDDQYRFMGRRLLLAEDNKLNAEIAREILEGYGFAVECAVDGVMCLEMLKKAEPEYYDMILMDIQMPNMDGYEATEKIRRLSGPQKDIPIIALTANAFEEDMQHAFAVGMNAHVAKPIDVATLIETIIKFLKENNEQAG